MIISLVAQGFCLSMFGTRKFRSLEYSTNSIWTSVNRCWIFYYIPYIGDDKYLCLNLIVNLLINKQYIALRYRFIQLFDTDRNADIKGAYTCMMMTIHALTIMTSSVSGASDYKYKQCRCTFSNPLKEGKWGKTNGNTVMHFLKILIQNISDSLAEVLKDKSNNWSWH